MPFKHPSLDPCAAHLVSAAVAINSNHSQVLIGLLLLHLHLDGQETAAHALGNERFPKYVVLARILLLVIATARPALRPAPAPSKRAGLSSALCLAHSPNATSIIATAAWSFLATGPATMDHRVSGSDAAPPLKL